MLYEIAINPEFQTELRKEICAIPDHSFDYLNFQLPLLDAALKETLRLHPAILENHHEVKLSIMLRIYLRKIINWTLTYRQQKPSPFPSLSHF